MPRAIFDTHLKPWEIFGGKRPFFVKYADLVKDVIKDFKLKPIDERVLSPGIKMPATKSSTAKEAMAYFDPGIFGGKFFAHLHYRGDVYMLNREQWQAFTARVKDDFIKRLHSANTISIAQLQDLSDAIDPIA